MIRTDAGCSVSRFAELVGVPRRTYHARLARQRAGEVPKGPWLAPVVDRIEPTGEVRRTVAGVGLRHPPSRPRHPHNPHLTSIETSRGGSSPTPPAAATTAGGCDGQPDASRLVT